MTIHYRQSPRDVTEERHSHVFQLVVGEGEVTLDILAGLVVVVVVFVDVKIALCFTLHHKHLELM